MQMHSDVELPVKWIYRVHLPLNFAVDNKFILFKFRVTNFLLLSLFICSIRLELQPECIPGHG